MSLNSYPRPNLKRSEDTWQNLNGKWSYKVIKGEFINSSDFKFIDEELKSVDGEINVPYSMEAQLSDVGRWLKPDETLLMRRSFNIEVTKKDKFKIHFGAVDQKCGVWVNGVYVGYHEDGYIPFSLDISKVIKPNDNIITVAITDASNLGKLPYGKQRIEQGQIWYTPQSGIWQTVWLESTDKDHIDGFNYEYIEANKVKIWFSEEYNKPVNITIYQPTLNGMKDEDFLDKEYEEKLQVSTLKNVEIELYDIAHWSPEEPWLYPVKLEYYNDTVLTYMGLRKVSIEEVDGVKKIFLNGSPYFQSGVLDQGYYFNGLYTPPDDNTVVQDLNMVKSMSFNMIRKHIKVEPLSWYFHCDRLGLIVWQDMVNGGGKYNPMIIQILPFIGIHLKDNRYKSFAMEDEETRKNSLEHQKNVIDTLKGFPSIIMWVISNEGWGQFDAVNMAKLAKQQDPTRLIDHASGWHDQEGPDFLSPHVYYKKIRIKKDDRAVILSEFGGYSYPVENHSPQKPFGYRVFKDRKSYNEAVKKLYLEEVLPYKDRLSGIVYTQLSDVEDEVNGLITFDRKVVKWDIEELREINSLFIK